MIDGKKTVLLAQRTSDWRDLLIHVIQQCGYDVIAVNSAEGVTEALRHDVDLILLDLELVKEQAAILIAQLQKNQSTRDIPIICETRYGDPLLVIRVIEAGAKEILYKPFPLIDVPSIFQRNLYHPEESGAMTPCCTS